MTSLEKTVRAATERSGAKGKVAALAAQEAPEGPRWTQIAGDLAAAIEGGDYASGAVLPSAQAIADRYGVHRHTARQAFRHLQDLGLVSVERGRGTIVQGRRIPYRIGRRVSLRANFGASGIAVEGRIVESRRGVASPETAARLSIDVGDAVWEVRTLNLAAGAPVSTAMHRLCVARFPQFDRRLVDARASITAAFRSYAIADYVRLETRLAARAATEIEAELLGLEPGASVLQSTAIDGLPDATPLQAIDGAFHPDRVEFLVAPEG